MRTGSRKLEVDAHPEAAARPGLELRKQPDLVDASCAQSASPLAEHRHPEACQRADGHHRHRQSCESHRPTSSIESTPERDQPQARRHPSRRQPDQCARQRGAVVPEHGRDDQRRRNELAAIDQRHTRVRQQKIARSHRNSRQRPVEEPPANPDQAEHQAQMGYTCEHARDDHLRRLVLERPW